MEAGARGEADRPPGSPVHEDGMIWLQDQEDKAGRTTGKDGVVLSQSRSSGTQPHARAFAFIWSNSAWVIVPASRSCLADAI
jgi:hypothetical protein